MPAAQVRSNKAKVAEEQAKCWDLRIKGLSIDKIAEVTGIHRSTVQRRLDAARKELVYPLVDEFRQIENARYDDWLVRLYRELAGGADPSKVIPVMVRVSESRRRMNGMDAPERAQITVTETTQADLALQELLNEAKALAAAQADALLLASVRVQDELVAPDGS